MLGVTKLLCETITTERGAACKGHGHGVSPRLLQFSEVKRPIVVWNITKRCNLRCIHCYSDSLNQDYQGELMTEEAKHVVDDLAGFGVPVIIFSGGDPLLRNDIFEIANYAGSKGIRCALSTNGVLIDKATAKAIKDANFAYVGVSIDGIGEFNDRFRGMIGAYNMALEGIRNSRDAGVRTGLRLTLNKRTLPQLSAIFDLAEVENIPRVYISHLVYSGRGNKIKKDDLSHEETRKALDFIFEKAIEFHKKGLDKDVLTGNNDADGVYLYLKVKREDDAKAEKIYKLLRMRGGNSSGTAIGCIDNIGNVHADQFWSHYSFGNVKEKPFSQIWTDTKDPVMCGLKNKKESVTGRCGHCSYLDICGGNYRVRAEAVYGNVWAEDPACYLTDDEIGIYENSKCRIQNAKF
ncbi:MAG: radical SAM protein [Deltaproteobacteria bacterium]|nr:radical SAM protein [Deltaproteobacteria bacterium]